MNLKKTAAVGLAAMTIGLAFTEAADAQYRRHHRGGGWGRGGAVAAGVIGGALLGAALAPRPSYAAPGYVYEEAPPVYYAPPRASRPVLVGVQPTRNCEIRTYQDAYGRQFSQKVCPQGW